jgi:hypothetical protein
LKVNFKEILQHGNLEALPFLEQQTLSYPYQYLNRIIAATKTLETVNKIAIVITTHKWKAYKTVLSLLLGLNPNLKN